MGEQTRAFRVERSPRTGRSRWRRCRGMHVRMMARRVRTGRRVATCGACYGFVMTPIGVDPTGW
jgi:hypothetical protein